MSETPKPQALSCPNCGGAIQLRGFSHTLSAVCIQCLSILDTTTPSLEVIQQFQARERVIPVIPLGKRGKLHGDPYEVIGFQTRQILVDNIPYEWREYVLFNPYKGFRYLTEYDGHWNDVKAVSGLPTSTKRSGKPAVKWLGETFTHFQSATAETTYVMGEFPWQVRVGERVRTEDYVSPPRMLSAERTEGEVTWSIGEYKTGADIWRAFELAGSPPAATGVFANQPSPHTGKAGSAWRMAVLLLGLLALALFASSILMGQNDVFRRQYSFTPGGGSEPSFVTPVFALEGRPSNVEVSIRTNLDNQWAYFNFALINEATGHAYDFGREISYYHGRDSDGAWSEGRTRDRVLIPSVPAGRYYLRVEPEMQAGAATLRYELVVRRDVPWNTPFFIVAVLLLVPPVLRSLQSIGFESRRWQESDYAGGDE